MTLLNQKTYSAYTGGETGNNLEGLCLDLFSDQKNLREDLREGYASLEKARERDLSCGAFSIRLQFNPNRIKSSAADVGKARTNGRPCFLCLDHLPGNQKGILYRTHYLILCNPMPVFSPHFTVSHIDHRIQAIVENMDLFLRLAADLGSGWAVLYNGPRCGASAPDHLHFQIIPSGRMPIEKEIQDGKRFDLITQVENVFLYRGRNLGREVLALDGEDPAAVERIFKDFLEALQKVCRKTDEPMMNLIGLYKEGKWSLIVFPRRKHRPDAFWKEGEERMVVSPGAIDMGGVIVTPVEKDFERLDLKTIKGIYKEVSLEGKPLQRAIETIA